MVSASRDAELLRRVNSFQLIGPDGQPVRWALNLLHGAGLRDRVYGPELTLRLCAGAADAGIPVCFYGSKPEVVDRLSRRLRHQYPGLIVAGTESPPYRPLTPQEDSAMVDRIQQSGAGIVFIGLGCPKQDHFAFEHRERIRAVQVCVGAAFDFHAGTLPMAPAWMQKVGLEWAYRLYQEPKRLWRRYVFTNTLFVFGIGRTWLLQTARRLFRFDQCQKLQRNDERAQDRYEEVTP